jgi:ribonuclease HII
MEQDLEKTRLYEMFRYERQLQSQGSKRIAGIDEAGRGPLAGPVVAAACILPEGVVLPGLNDSKQVPEADRERLFHLITSLENCDWAIGVASAMEIDRINILKASFLAMYRALEQLQKKPEVILVDGHLAPSFGIPTVPLVKGDSKSASIAAASILAKVTRDRMMKDFDLQYPQYGFTLHKGYATPEHLKAVQAYGPCAIHRKSFEPVKSLCSTEMQADLF